MRHLQMWLLAAALAAVVAGAGLGAGTATPDFDGVSDSSWDTLLLGLGSGFTLAAPLLIALIASRLVDAEHRGGGWLMSATAGVAPGQLCRVKRLALGFLVAGATHLTRAAFTAALFAGATVPTSAAFRPVGFDVRREAAGPAARCLGLSLGVVAVNLALLALPVVLPARVENQLVGMGVGLLGTVLALFSSAVPAPIAALTPWGHYSLAAASEYVDGQLVARSPEYAAVAGLLGVAAGLCALLTRSFDRQEA